ncbi:MAG TPA: serine protease [Baekduia sp.]|jgi:hypothetical protein
MRRQLPVVMVLGLPLPVAPASAIVGGAPTNAARYPWFVSLDGCGGTLIAPDHVLTAAHCAAGKTPAALGRVRFGGSMQTRRATAFAAEPRYVTAQLDGTENPVAARYDVAVVALDRPVSGIAPIRLLGAPVRAGRRVELLGRGAISSRTSGPPSSGRTGLHRAALTTIADAHCTNSWRHADNAAYHHAFLPDVMLCAQAPQRSICQGDSGGPLLVRTRSGAVRQAGVASWLGNRCGTGPSVFAQVSALRAFIDHRDEPWAPVASTRPARIAGTPRVGATLTCVAPLWIAPPTSVAYRWTAYRTPTISPCARPDRRRPTSSPPPTSAAASAASRSASPPAASRPSPLRRPRRSRVEARAVAGPKSDGPRWVPAEWEDVQCGPFWSESRAGIRFGRLALPKPVRVAAREGLGPWSSVSRSSRLGTSRRSPPTGRRGGPAPRSSAQRARR